MKILSLPDILPHLTEKVQADITSVDAEFPVKISQYYFNLIDFDNLAKDPIFKQCIPESCELRNTENEHEDPLNEEQQMPVPSLIHRYQDRAVLLVNNCCAVHCRFCLRKRKWKRGSSQYRISYQELNAVCEYLEQHQEIKEVLISGGDPLILEIGELRKILLRISQIPAIEIMRVGTRIPVVMPARINEELVEMLASFSGLWLATHFNHPRELTKESLSACSMMIQRGIPIINQTVLLKGINDDVEILADLFRTLAKNKIKPHYLFHVDPVRGNGHFATGIAKGLEIMKALRNKISSLATPTFAIDLPEGGGKVPLQANYESTDGFESIDGRYIKY